MDTVLIFAGGDSPGLEVIEDLPQADLVVAADGGYDSATRLGVVVDVVVGDLDSISTTELPHRIVVERHPRDKDATDLELALELVARDRPDRVVVVGGSGGRLDHELATAALLCSPRWRGFDELDWITERGRAHVVWRRRVLHGDVGATVTLLPVGGDAEGIHTRGLRWNLEGERLAVGSSRGVSNVMEAPVADIRLASGCLLVVIPNP
ncbi:MAG: thiamine diphosphokinase [Acidimicrobiia bacterium]